MSDVARELAVRNLVRQGASPEWAEAHVEDAKIVNGVLSYRTRIDHPVECYAGEFSIENPFRREVSDADEE